MPAIKTMVVFIRQTSCVSIRLATTWQKVKTRNIDVDLRMLLLLKQPPDTLERPLKLGNFSPGLTNAMDSTPF